MIILMNYNNNDNKLPITYFAIVSIETRSITIACKLVGKTNFVAYSEVLTRI